ncbi:unnamed protein product, partial [Sphacelaria rigidula]
TATARVHSRKRRAETAITNTAFNPNACPLARISMLQQFEATHEDNRSREKHVDQGTKIPHPRFKSKAPEPRPHLHGCASMYPLFPPTSLADQVKHTGSPTDHPQSC